MILFVTGLSNDSEQIRSVVCRLLQRGLNFTGCAEQCIPSELPENWEEYDALIIDSAILERYAGDPDMRKRLENYAGTKFVLPLYNRLSPDSGNWRDMTLTDVNMFATAAGLRRGEIPERPVAELIPLCVERIRHFYSKEFEGRDILGEFFLHLPLAMLSLEKSSYAPDGWSNYINDVLQKSFQIRDFAGDHDQVAAWNWAHLYSLRTGDAGAAEFMLHICDTLRARRPRTPEGVISPGGFVDDPLFFSKAGTHRFCTQAGTVAKRNLVMNENFHYLAGLFASAYEISGKQSYLDEAVKMLLTIAANQLDPSDNLLYHASCRGKAVGSKWARGCGHGLYGAYYMLRMAPSMPDHVKQLAIDFIDRVGHGLAAVQLPCGAWRNVLDSPVGEPELSSTAMFAALYSTLINEKLLDRDFYLPMLSGAFSALRRYVWRGVTINTAGTFVAGDNPDYYLRRPDFFYPVAWIIPALIETEKVLNYSNKTQGV